MKRKSFLEPYQLWAVQQFYSIHWLKKLNISFFPEENSCKLSKKCKSLEADLEQVVLVQNFCNFYNMLQNISNLSYCRQTKTFAFFFSNQMAVEYVQD